jgi:hypothetical protein
MSRSSRVPLICAVVFATLCASAAAAAPPSGAAVPAAFAPKRAADLRWIAAIFTEFNRDDGFARLSGFLGKAPRANGSFTQLQPHAPLFAEVLLRDEKHATGARTQTVIVRFADGQQPAVAALERRFGKARNAPPMADRMGQNVHWTKIIHLGPPRIQGGHGRIVMRLAGGAKATRAKEITLDLYSESPARPLPGTTPPAQ